MHTRTVQTSGHMQTGRQERHTHLLPWHGPHPHMGTHQEANSSIALQIQASAVIAPDPLATITASLHSRSNQQPFARQIHSPPSPDLKPDQQTKLHEHEQKQNSEIQAPWTCTTAGNKNWVNTTMLVSHMASLQESHVAELMGSRFDSCPIIKERSTCQQKGHTKGILQHTVPVEHFGMMHRLKRETQQSMVPRYSEA